MFVGSAVHEEHVEQVGHVPGKRFASQKTIYELLAFIRRFVVQERLGVSNAGDDAGQVEI